MIGTQMWSTREVEPSQLRGYWESALDEIMPGLRFDPLAGEFEASLRQRTLGNLCLNFVRALPQRVHTPTRPRSGPQSRFALVYLRSGLLRIDHCARSIELRPGECVIIDGNEACEVITCSESESLNIAVSANWAQQWLTRPESEVAKAFVPDVPAARPLLGLLDLFSDGDAQMPFGDTMLLNQLGGALAIAVGNGEVVGTNHSARLLNRMKQAIAARYYDADYCPQIAADEAGISRRYLVSLFANAGTTFNTELMRIRLERSAQMMLEPRFASLSVMEISLRCGFSDASHFSKRFRAKYGISPACYRASEQKMPGLALLN